MRLTVPRRAANLAIQAQALRGRFPGSKLSLRRTSMTWTACLHPTELSRKYTVQIRYHPPSLPQVKVLPQLATRPGEPLPHVYREGVLCLHKAGEWSQDMLIADTIVPWTCEWLIHYEIWFATGQWHGGGEGLEEEQRTDRSSGGAGDSRHQQRRRRAA